MKTRKLVECLLLDFTAWTNFGSGPAASAEPTTVLSQQMCLLMRSGQNVTANRLCNQRTKPV